MTIELPGYLKGMSFDQVLPVELNDFDVETILPSIFFRVVTQGKAPGQRNDPSDIDGYVDQLAIHPQLVGFDSIDGRRLLKRLARTSLVQIARRGRGRSAEQIIGFGLPNLLTFKPGFPEQRSRLRRVDDLLYRILSEETRGGHAGLLQFCQDIFGSGVQLDPMPRPNGRYNGAANIDTLTVMMLLLLDGFEPAGVTTPSSRVPYEAMPAVASRFSRDFHRFLTTYHSRMEVGALTHHLYGLIAFELAIYTVKLFHSISALVEQPSVLPDEMRNNPEGSLSHPELYFDFTDKKVRLSYEMSRYCVQRDLQSIHTFLQANIKLRILRLFILELRDDEPSTREIINETLGNDLGGPVYLQNLIQLMKHPDIQLHLEASARSSLREVRDFNSDDAAGGQQRLNRSGRRARGGTAVPRAGTADPLDASIEEINSLVGQAQNSFDGLVRVVTETQRSGMAQNIASWYRSVGGISSDYGMLAGTVRDRATWHYGPRNDLLTILVLLAMVDIPRWNAATPAPRPVRLRDFLNYLETRFGILVDRPPQNFRSAEAMAAAHENLKAMLSKLRQMGIFRDLSDDFTVQLLIPPYGE